MNRTRTTTLAIAALALAACSDSPVVAIRIELAADLTGTVTTSGLLVPQQPTPLESDAAGIEWQQRAALACASGSFATVDGLRVADITFVGKRTESGVFYMQVTLPRGEDARWRQLLLPAAADRAAVEKTFDPRGDLGHPASRITIEIGLPVLPVSYGVRPAARGVTSSASGRRVSLNVQAALLERGAPLTWHLTW